MLTKAERPVVLHAEHRFTGKRPKPGTSSGAELMPFSFTLTWFMCSATFVIAFATAITLLTRYSCSTDTAEKK